MKLPITLHELSSLHTRYYRDGHNDHLRFGQWFCNYFNLTNPDLFYEESDMKAYSYIMGNYVVKDVEHTER